MKMIGRRKPLPKEFQNERRLLLPAFKKAREENKKLLREQ